MKLEFTLGADLFEDEGLFNQYATDIKEGKKSIRQVKAIVGNSINIFYMSLIRYIKKMVGDFNSETPIKREVIYKYIDDSKNPELNYKYLHILKMNNIIEVCGSGLLFNEEQE